MATALANVQLAIKIGATDSASDVIRKTQDSMKGLKTTAEETSALGDKFSEVGETAASGLGKVARLGRPLASFAGDASAEVRELGHGLHGLDLLLTLLPGPIGMTVGALAALAGGAFLLNKHFSEAAAKMELLGGPGAAALKDGLDVDTDTAIKLSHALDDLANKSLVPSDALLKQVGENAERIGKEPSEAMLKFVAAIAAGPDELVKFQREFGRLNGMAGSTKDLAASLGFSPETLGLSKAMTAEEQKKRDLTEALTTIELRRADMRSAEEQATLAQARQHQTIRAGAESHWQEEQASQERIVVAMQAKVDKETALVNDMVRESEIAAAIAASQGNLHSRIALLDAQAAAATDKKAKYSLQEQAATAAQLEAKRALNKFDNEHGKTTDDSLQKSRNELEVALLTADARNKTIKTEKDADAKSAKEKGKSAQQAYLQSLDAEAQAVMHLAKAEADAALGSAAELGLKIKLIAAEESAAIESSKKVHTTRLGHRAAEDAAHIEASVKRRALEVEEAQKASEQHQQTLDEQEKAQRARAQTFSQLLQAQGREQEAIDTELAQTRADAAATVLKAENQLENAIESGKKSQRELAEMSEQVAAKRVIATETVEQAELRAEQERQAIKVKNLEAAGRAIDGVVAQLSAIGQTGNLTAAALAQSISSITKGFIAWGSIADKDKDKLSKTVAAVGEAASGITNSIINASSQRLLQQIDVEEQSALSHATTEAQKAAITEKYEKKKADARDAAQRESAAVAGLVAAAQAVAYAFTPGMQTAAIGQGVAAAMFAAIAGGAAGSSYVPGAATAGSGGFNASGASGAGGTAGSGSGGVTLVTNFNGVYATQQQVGKALNASTASLAGTGITQRKGA